jgi:hypothetical protein
VPADEPSCSCYEKHLAILTIRAPVIQRARLKIRPVQYLLDIGVLSAASFLAYALWFEFDVPRSLFRQAVTQLPLVILVQFGALSLRVLRRLFWEN